MKCDFSIDSDVDLVCHFSKMRVVLSGAEWAQGGQNAEPEIHLPSACVENVKQKIVDDVNVVLHVNSMFDIDRGSCRWLLRFMCHVHGSCSFQEPRKHHFS